MKITVHRDSKEIGNPNTSSLFIQNILRNILTILVLISLDWEMDK